MLIRTFFIINSDKNSTFQEGQFNDSNIKSLTEKVINYFRGLVQSTGVFSDLEQFVFNQS